MSSQQIALAWRSHTLTSSMRFCAGKCAISAISHGSVNTRIQVHWSYSGRWSWQDINELYPCKVNQETGIYPTAFSNLDLNIPLYDLTSVWARVRQQFGSKIASLDTHHDHDDCCVGARSPALRQKLTQLQEVLAQSLASASWQITDYQVCDGPARQHLCED